MVVDPRRYGLSGFAGALAAPAARYSGVQRRTSYSGSSFTVSTVNATGTVKPKLQISVGSFVSGPIDPEYPIADFNQEVKKGDMLAKIQETIYEANVQRDKANLWSREADVKRFEALLHQAERDLTRALNLQAENKDFIAGAEIDKFRFGRDSLAAQLDLAYQASACGSPRRRRCTASQRDIVSGLVGSAPAAGPGR